MQKIRLKGNHFYNVMRGAGLVVRLSKKTPELGEAVLYCENVPPHEINVIINCVRVIHFENLNAFDVMRSGFKSLEHLRHELQEFYGREIDQRTPVKVIEFFKDKDKDK